MSLEPTGEVAVGDYSGSVTPDAQLEVKGDPNDNISTLFEVLEGGSSSSRGNEVLTVNDNGNVGIGTSSPTRTLVVDGFVIPNSDAVEQLGESGNRWEEVWAQNGTIQTSDRRLKSGTNI
jgi:hypothetical protein